MIKETEKKIRIGVKKLEAITGFINKDGDIIASDELSRHDDVLFHGQSYCKDIYRNDSKWRCHYDDGIVRWWDQPTDEQKNLVEDFLKRWYNVEVRGNTMYSMVIKESTPNWGYIGIITPNEDIQGRFIKDPWLDSHSLRFGTGVYTGWRYFVIIKELCWDGEPTEKEKMLVHDWLKKSGYDVKKDRNIFKENIKVMVKELILEGVKDKIKSLK